MVPQEQNAAFLLGPEETDTACLLIHGFSGTPVEMRGLGEALAQHNIRVYGLCLPGHGGNPDDLIRPLGVFLTKRYLDFAQFLRKSFFDLFRYNSRNVFVFFSRKGGFCS